jgi:2'-hydroxyisoflavone reductase
VLGDRNGGLAALGDETWEACVDVSGYLPRLVRASAGHLSGRVGRYVYVSTISVYADFTVPRNEEAPLATIADETTEEITGETYGALKALCELAVTGVFGPRGTIVRPGFVFGPHDHTARFPWWAHRAARGGEMIVPAGIARAFQAIDVRDLADFLILAAHVPLAGVFNATGPVPPVTMLDLVEEAARQSGAALRVTVVDDDFLTAEGVETELPLWSNDPAWAQWAQIDVSRAIAAGLRFHPIADTVAATLAHSTTIPGIGLEPEREAELLAAWHAREA